MYVYAHVQFWVYPLGIDIIMLVFQQQNKCESINDGLINLDDWIMVGTIMTIILVGCWCGNACCHLCFELLEEEDICCGMLYIAIKLL